MKKQLIGAVLGLCLLSPLAAEAANDMSDSEYEAIYGKPPVREEVVEESEQPAKVETDTDKKEKSDVEKKREATRHRYKKIGTDQSFTYYADTKNMRWRYIPNTKEQMVDVWIKLLPGAVYADSADEANYAEHYFLMHYYLRPKQQQIQFLGETEVSGRPTNQIQERAYNTSHWENLVPGSVEDTIYHAVMDCIEEMPQEGKKSNFQSIGDGIEDVLHIAL